MIPVKIREFTPVSITSTYSLSGIASDAFGQLPKAEMRNLLLIVPYASAKFGSEKKKKLRRRKK
jgi:hypothetical protein